MQSHPAYPAHVPQQPVMPQQVPVSIDGIVGIAKPLLAVLGMRAALPIVLRFVPVYQLVGDPQLAGTAIEGLKGLLGLTAIILYLVWFGRMYSWVRATRGGTRFSNGMAIGGWFIPLANAVLPYLALRDAWRRGANDEQGWLVAAWWLSYLAATLLGVLFSAGLHHILPSDIHTARAIGEALSWAFVLSQIAAWGLLFYFVRELTRRAGGR